MRAEPQRRSEISSAENKKENEEKRERRQKTMQETKNMTKNQEEEDHRLIETAGGMAGGRRWKAPAPLFLNASLRDAQSGCGV
jgi:hypothetical protein